MRRDFGRRRARQVVLLGLITTLLGRSAPACPFCGILELTLRERIETPDFSLLVEWVSGEEGNIETQVPPATTFRVLKVWRGEMAVGRSLTIDHFYEGAPAERSLLIGNKVEDIVRWDRTITLTPQALEYVNSLPSSEASIDERLQHAFAHLESTDTLIANDAFSVVGSAKYEQLVAARGHIDVDSLRRWVHNPETLVMRLGVYGMLLGVVGSEQDIQAMHQRIFTTDADRDIRVGIDGVMGGYLLLSGAEGLAELERAYLANPQASQDDVNAVTSALRFVWEYGDGRISPERLRQSMRLALQHEETQEIAIVDLARWQDWSITPQVVALYPDAYRGLQRRIVGFLSVAAEADEQNLSEEQRAGIELARQTLAKIEQDDPILYRSARRGLIPR
jgi:hypothetical protein